MKKSESIQNIATALCKFQMEVKNPGNNATNPMYKSKYATLDNVINTVKPILSKYGLAYLQSPSTSDDGLYIGMTTLLMHESGEWIESDPILLPAYKLGKDGVKVYDAQAAGIATTYSRRYSLSSVLGISSEDDDDANGIIHESGSNGKPISPKQIGLIKTHVKRIAMAKNIQDEAVYEKLGVKNVEQLSGNQASKAIETLNKWVEQLKPQQVFDNDLMQQVHTS